MKKRVTAYDFKFADIVYDKTAEKLTKILLCQLKKKDQLCRYCMVEKQCTKER